MELFEMIDRHQAPWGDTFVGGYTRPAGAGVPLPTIIPDSLLTLSTLGPIKLPPGMQCTTSSQWLPAIGTPSSQRTNLAVGSPPADPGPGLDSFPSLR